MDSVSDKPRLVLIPGGLSEEADAAIAGPITRMGLWHRFPQPSKAQMVLILVAKVLLLTGALVYFLH